MPTAFTKGDIFETDGITAFAFGANTSGTMDAGIAVAMKKRWPAFALAFAERCKDAKFKLGDVFLWTDGEVSVFALAIQDVDKKPSMSALTNAVRRMLVLTADTKIKRIGMPRIVGNPTGLDWLRVRKMLGEVTVGSPVRLDVFDQFIRATKPVTVAAD